MAKAHINLVLDSGAYSLWKKQQRLTVGQYIKFIQRFDDVLWHYVNLDVIPGQWGRVPSPAQVEASAQEGWNNLITMRKEGLNPIPVYHMGERRYWLDKMLGEGFEYIGISPANDRTTKQKIEWLDETFGYLCGTKGFPTVKTHGFGVTALPILFRYPWFSVDSITWLLVAAYGGILVPQRSRDGGYCFATSPNVVAFSDKPSAAALDHGKHFDGMGEASQQYVLNYLNEEGFDIKELRTNYLARQRVNCRFFKKAVKAYDKQPFFQKRTGLFGSGPVSTLGTEKDLFGNIRMIFTLTTSPEHSDILEDEGVKDRLLTYYYFKDSEPFDIREYCLTGRITLKKKKKKKAAKAAAPREVLEAAAVDTDTDDEE